jgi:hypothetical protein
MSWPWLNAIGIDVDIGADGSRETIAGILAASAAFAAIGLGIGALLRDQLAAVAGLLVYLFVVEPVITRIPAITEWTAYLPGPAAAALTRATLIDQDFLPPWTGGLLLLAYAAATYTAGAVLTRTPRHHLRSRHPCAARGTVAPRDGQGRGGNSPRQERCGSTLHRPPGLETPDQIRGGSKAQLLQGRGGETRAVPLAAHDNHAHIGVGDDRQPMW